VNGEHSGRAPSTSGDQLDLFEPLTWKGAKQCKEVLTTWRGGIMQSKHRAVAIKLCWLIYELCRPRGYCYASDTYFMDVLGVNRSMVQRTLAEIEDDGRIVREIVKTRKGRERRIRPAARVTTVYNVVDTEHVYNGVDNSLCVYNRVDTESERARKRPASSINEVKKAIALRDGHVPSTARSMLDERWLRSLSTSARADSQHQRRGQGERQRAPSGRTAGGSSTNDVSDTGLTTSTMPRYPGETIRLRSPFPWLSTKQQAVISSILILALVCAVT
jgi:hypothetical protein